MLRNKIRSGVYKIGSAIHTANVNRKTNAYMKAVAPAKENVNIARDKTKGIGTRTMAAVNAKVKMDSATYHRNEMQKAQAKSQKFQDKWGK